MLEFNIFISGSSLAYLHLSLGAKKGTEALKNHYPALLPNSHFYFSDGNSFCVLHSPYLANFAPCLPIKKEPC